MHMQTDVGAGEAERNPGSSAPKPAGRRRDVNSITDMMKLACEIAEGDARRATMLSLDETRAIARLAAHSSLVMAAACAVFAASDRLDGTALRTAFYELAKYTRPFMGAK